MTRGAERRIIADVPSPPAGFDAEAVPPALRALLPERFTLQPARHGHSASVAFVRGEGDGDAQALVLKRAAEPPYVDWLGAEGEVLQALARSGLPVPRLLGVHQTAHEAWLLLTRLPGEPLVEALRVTPEAARPDCFRRLGGLLASIHTTPVPPSLLARDSTPWWERPRPELGSTSDEVLSVTRLDGERAPPAVFVHGDFTLDNVLAQQGRPSGVVDWGGAGRGDPRYDVALALLSADEGRSGLPSAASVSAFYDGYLDAVAGVDAELYAYFSSSARGG